MSKRNPKAKKQGIWHRKFEAPDIQLMRTAYAEYLRLRTEAEKLSPANLAAKFEIRTSTFYEIVNHQTYRDII